MSLNKYMNRCYHYSKGNGFWDLETINGNLLRLVPEQMKIGNLIEKARKLNNTVEEYKYRESINVQERLVASKLMLICSEAVEALDALFNEGKLNEEVADIMIRAFDLAGYLNMDLKKEVENKMTKNEKRPFRHGKKC